MLVSYHARPHFHSAAASRRRVAMKGSSANDLLRALGQATAVARSNKKLRKLFKPRLCQTLDTPAKESFILQQAGLHRFCCKGPISWVASTTALYSHKEMNVLNFLRTFQTPTGSNCTCDMCERQLDTKRQLQIQP